MRGYQGSAAPRYSSSRRRPGPKLGSGINDVLIRAHRLQANLGPGLRRGDEGWCIVRVRTGGRIQRLASKVSAAATRFALPSCAQHACVKPTQRHIISSSRRRPESKLGCGINGELKPRPSPRRRINGELKPLPSPRRRINGELRRRAFAGATKKYAGPLIRSATSAPPSR
jgi:hypothetical protein